MAVATCLQVGVLLYIYTVDLWIVLAQASSDNIRNPMKLKIFRSQTVAKITRLLGFLF